MESGKSPYDAPWSTRARISSGSDEVTSAISVPSRTASRMPIITGRLPWTSPSRPSTGVSTAAASRFAVSTQATAARLASSCWAIIDSTGTTSVCSSARFATVTARATISRPVLFVAG
jgi:hypothetical protein